MRAPADDGSSRGDTEPRTEPWSRTAARHLAALVLLLALGAVAAALAISGTGDDGDAASPTDAPGGPDPGDDAVTELDGWFRTEGAGIVAPDGRPFVPMGVNILGPRTFWPFPSEGLARPLQEAWGFNAVRIVSCLPEGCNEFVWEVNDDLDALVDEYVERDMVAMIELHNFTGRLPTDEEMPAVEEWWREVAARYADEPYVWFNLLNEPRTGENPGEAVDPRWLEVHQRLTRVVRSVAPRNLIVYDGTAWGQEAPTYGAELVQPHQSAILAYGPTLQSEFREVVFSVHVYDRWGDPSLTDTQRDARFAAYVDAVQGRGLPLLIGETGWDVDDPDPYVELGARTAFRVAPSRDVGIFAWHATPGDGFRLTVEGPADAVSVPIRAGELSVLGELMLAATREVLGPPPYEGSDSA